MAKKIGILLLHGLTGVPSEMSPVEKHLQKMGFDTEAPTLAGHGGSHEELLDATWKDWIDSAEAAFARLSERVDSVVVSGLSMGASIAAVLAARHPSAVAGLIMLSPTLAYDSPELDDKLHLRIYKIRLVRDFLHLLLVPFPWIGKRVYWTETPPYGLRDERLQRQITKAIEAAKRGEDTKFGLFRTYFLSLQQMNYITDAFRTQAPKVECPVLAVSSLEDTLVSISNATTAYTLLGAKNKSLAMLTGCDHVLTLDLRRKYLCRLVGEFMQSLTDMEDPIGSKVTESGLTLEVHNRLNPLSQSDWDRLVPGNQPMETVVALLQQTGAHESQCHSLVIRFNNEPILMVPLFFIKRELPAAGNPALAIVKAFAQLLAPEKLHPLTATFGLPETSWNQSSGAECDHASMQQAWDMVTKVAADLSRSAGATATAFMNDHGFAAARICCITNDSLSQWLVENAPTGDTPIKESPASETSNIRV